MWGYFAGAKHTLGHVFVYSKQVFRNIWSEIKTFKKMVLTNRTRDMDSCFQKSKDLEDVKIDILSICL